MKQFASRLIVMLLMVSMLIPSVVPQTVSHPLTQKEVQMYSGGLPVEDCAKGGLQLANSCYSYGINEYLCLLFGFVAMVVCIVDDGSPNG